MNITHAGYTNPNEGITAVVDGHHVVIELTKKSLLDLGVAVMTDVNPDRPWAENLLFQLPADPDDGRSSPLPIEGGTDDPVVVCLARRYWLAANGVHFKAGLVPIPTIEEAQRENANWVTGR